MISSAPKVFFILPEFEWAMVNSSFGAVGIPNWDHTHATDLQSLATKFPIYNNPDRIPPPWEGMPDIRPAGPVQIIVVHATLLRADGIGPWLTNNEVLQPLVLLFEFHTDAIRSSGWDWYAQQVVEIHRKSLQRLRVAAD